MRKVAYKLDLPSASTVYSTVHVSQLKCYHKSKGDFLPSLPTTQEDTEEELEPSSILERKIIKRGNQAETIVLVWWRNQPITTAT